MSNETPDVNETNEAPSNVPFYKNKRILAIAGATTAVVATIGLGARALFKDETEDETETVSETDTSDD